MHNINWQLRNRSDYFVVVKMPILQKMCDMIGELLRGRLGSENGMSQEEYLSIVENYATAIY